MVERVKEIGVNLEDVHRSYQIPEIRHLDIYKIVKNKSFAECVKVF